METRTDFGELIVAIATRRDRHAFARLFAFYAPRVKAMAMRTGASGEIAEDIAQDAMVAVWQKAAQFDPKRASAGTWIFTIARNLRIDGVRAARRADALSTDWPEPESETAPDEIVNGMEQEARVRAVLRDLSADQMQVVQLSFFEGRAHGDISTHLGIPLGTVKSRLRLALTRLRAALDDLR